MHIVCLAVGRLKPGAESELTSRYFERARKLGRGLGFQGFTTVEIAESRAVRAANRMAQEGEALAAQVAGSGRIVCLHAGSSSEDSESFAAALRRDADAGVPRLVFVIGGPDGLSPAVLARADRQLSFGRLTWPHQLVRVLLAEQLYRAMTILSGHPYHRA